MKFVNAKTLGILGSLLIVVGMFLPLYTGAVSHSSNFFTFPATQYVLLLVLVAAALALSFTRYIRHVLWLGIVIALFLGLAIYGLYRTMQQYRLTVSTELSDEIREQFADRVTVNLGSGWVLLFLGAALLIACGILARRKVKLPGEDISA